MIESLPDISTVIVPIGGGGLISGIATAVKLGRMLNYWCSGTKCGVGSA
jgi:threonine dehydratase